ncbi:MAG: serine/threonine-protein kinase [Candidatus Zixiibacteriota bacterium]
MSDEKDKTRPGFEGGNVDPLGIVGWEIGGKYKIKSYIGGGGFGEVYLGFNKNLPDQRLVFKFFKRVQLRDKFDKEARILCLLDHPNISRVIDYLPEEGAVVVAFIDGKDGSHLLKETGGLPEGLMLKVAQSLSSAVAYAHQKNIAHRDLKPGNVMFDTNDHVYLIDFGIAKEIGSQATKTAYQALTPMFAAPERQDGESDYDPFLSDIFETGVTLYNFATNDLPYRNPANPNYNEWGGEAANKLSPEFKRILRKATHPLPDMRYKNAGDMAQDLASLKNVYGGEEPAPKKKGGKGLTIAISLIAVLIIVGYFTKDYWMPYYGKLTAKNVTDEKSTEAEKEPELEQVIDSIIGNNGSSDSIITETEIQVDSLAMEGKNEIASIEPPTQNTKTQENTGQIASEQNPKPEIKEPQKTVNDNKTSKPVEEKKEEIAQKPVEETVKETVVENLRNAMIVKVVPAGISLLMVDDLEASKDSTFMLLYGNHSVTVYHPDFPIFRKTVYMSKTSRAVDIDLAKEYLANAKATLQIAMSPPSENHFVDLSFNGKSNTLTSFPVFDIVKLKGNWLLEASIIDVSGDNSKAPRIDSIVTYPYGGGQYSSMKGDRGEIILGSKDWNDETVPFLIYWSE